MKPELKLFILPTCPYCRQVLGWIDELKNEDAKYSAVNLTIVDEKAQPDVASKYDYYYVPTFFLGADKIHEGAASKDIVRKVFDQYLG